MNLIDWLIGRSPETESDSKLKSKLKALGDKSERVSEKSKRKLSEPQDALDKLADMDRTEQALHSHGRAHTLGRDRS